MAIAYDNSGQSSTGSASSKTFAYTVNSNTNGILFVGICGIDTNHVGVSTVTYAGVTLTALINRTNDTTCLGNRFIYIGYVLLPATGSNNVVVTFGGTIGQDSSITVASYTGVNQTTPTDSSSQNIDTQCLAAPISTQTLTTTTTVDNDWLITVNLEYGNGSTVTAGTNTTIRQQVSGGGGDRCIFADTNAAQTPTGSHSINLSLSPADNIGGYVYGLQPSVAAGPANVKTWDAVAKASVKTFFGLAIASTKTVDGVA